MGDFFHDDHAAEKADEWHTHDREGAGCRSECVDHGEPDELRNGKVDD